MARIQFTSEVEEYIGKFAGSIFQDSYMGLQVRGWYKPRNPQTQLQQLRRGNFRFLAAGWRNLTSTQKGTFIAVAGTIPEALRLYIGANINLLLIGLSIINTYTSAAAPTGLQLVITTLTDAAFTVQSTGSITTVPAGCKLLLYATAGKAAGKIFTNPSQYEPIKYFEAGTDLSSETDVTADWIAHYGILQLNKRICIKSVIIDQSNGNRSVEYIACALSPYVSTTDIIDSDGTYIIDSDGTFILAYE